MTLPSGVFKVYDVSIQHLHTKVRMNNPYASGRVGSGRMLEVSQKQSDMITITNPIKFILCLLVDSHNTNPNQLQFDPQGT